MNTQHGISIRTIPYSGYLSSTMADFVLIEYQRLDLAQDSLFILCGKPWDYVFSRRQAYWVIVHLRDGRKIGGRFDRKSFASSYPADEQIYIEEVWRLDEDGRV